ncbi:MAG: PF20097 family protein [Thermoplasmata archaeon]
MSDSKCAVCGGALEAGFVATSNGSGLFWSHQASTSRFRPKGLEVLVGTEFGGTYSANLPGLRCPKCRTILLSLPQGKSA